MTKQDRGSRIEDRGFRPQDSSAGDKELPRFSHPRSSILDPVSMQRIRWRCRRGLLELDIVLGRFIEHYASLTRQQQAVFDSLLDLPDTELWDMIGGKLPALQAEQHELLVLINAA